MTGIANRFVTGQVFRTKVQELTLRGLRSEISSQIGAGPNGGLEHQVEGGRLGWLLITLRMP